MLELKIRRSICRLYPHHSDGLTAYLVGIGGGTSICRWKSCCSGICWLGGCGGGGLGTSIVLVPGHCSSMAYERCTLVRAAMPCRGLIVSSLNQSSNGATS